MLYILHMLFLPCWQWGTYGTLLSQRIAHFFPISSLSLPHNHSKARNKASTAWNALIEQPIGVPSMLPYYLRL
jgi:hypothetical protein